MSAQQDIIFEALADPTRRQILEWLDDSPTVTATWVANRLPITRQAATKHLMTLENAGLVVGTKVGREMQFSAQEGSFEQAGAWIEARATAWDSRLQRLKAKALEMDQREA